MIGTGSQSWPEDHESPIEEYLDRLLVELVPGPPRQIRHLLAETEAHLRDAAREGVERGLTPSESEQEAVRRFGPAAAIAGAERLRRVTSLWEVARQFLSSGWFLGAVGAMAVGVSGVIAAILRSIGGSRFIADVRPGRVLSASDCARWLAANPAAHTCRQAAVSDWADETVVYRIAFGLLGAAAMLAFVFVRRRLRSHHRWVALPPTVVDTVAATLFGASGVWLLGLGLDAVVRTSGHGAGQWLSAAPVALAAAAVFAARLVRDLRRQPALGP